MNKALIAATAAAAALVAAPAVAQDAQSYGNIGYSYADFDGADFDVIHGRIGAHYEHVGGEVEAGFGVNSDSVADLDWSVAAYATGWLTINDSFALIGRIGAGYTGYSAPGVEDSDFSFNYGVGAQFTFGDNGVRADYTRWDYQDLEEADVWSLSYVRKF